MLAITTETLGGKYGFMIVVEEEVATGFLR